MNPDDIERRVAKLESENVLCAIKHTISCVFLIAIFICLLISSCHGGERVFEVTAYCACRKCCGHWSGGPTASGRMPENGVTVAAPRSIPFGTKLDIEGVGIRRVDDRLAKRFDHRIDLFMGSDKEAHKRARRWGNRKLRVTW